MISVEQFLKWKILPRCMMLASTVMSWRCAEWFMELDVPTASQSAFVSVVMGVMLDIARPKVHISNQIVVYRI